MASLGLRTYNLCVVHLLHPLELLGILLELVVDLLDDDPAVLGPGVALLDVIHESGKSALVDLGERESWDTISFQPLSVHTRVSD